MKLLSDLKKYINVPVLLLVLVVASWASATVVTKHLFLAQLATPFSLTALRFTIAGTVALLLLTFMRRIYYSKLPAPSKTPSAHDVMYLPLWVRVRAHILGGGLITVFIFGFNTALLYITASLGGIIFFGLTPMIVLFGGWWWLGIPVKSRQLIWIGVALVGLLVVLSGGDIGRLLDSLRGSNLGWGIGLMIFSAVGWGGYSLWGKRYSSIRPEASLLSTGINQLIGVLPMWVLAVLIEPGKLTQFNLEAWLYIIYIGIVPSAIGFAAFYALIPRLSLNQLATIQLFSPVFTTSMAVLFLGEPLTIALAIGTLILLWGVYRSQR